MDAVCITDNPINESTTMPLDFGHDSVAQGQEDNIIRVCADALPEVCSAECSFSKKVSDIRMSEVRTKMG